MRIQQLLETSDFLFESAFVQLWEEAIDAVTEANLTVEQIAHLFENADKPDNLILEHPIYGMSPLEQRMAAQKQQASSSAPQQQAPQQVAQRQAPQQQQAPQQPTEQQGGSKIGNAFAAVKNVYNSIKNAIQNSGPVSAFDQKADQLLGKLKNSVGGDNGTVMQAVTKYRDFAKKHPIMQGVIYAALIGLSGLSGAGLGGAVLLGAIKMVDKLLQGNKASSALWSGFLTGATSYGVSQVAQHLRGGDAASSAASSGATYPGDIAKVAQKSMIHAIRNGDIHDYNSYMDYLNTAVEQSGKGASMQSRQMAGRMLDTMMKKMAADAAGGQVSGSGPQVIDSIIQAVNGQ